MCDLFSIALYPFSVCNEFLGRCFALRGPGENGGVVRGIGPELAVEPASDAAVGDSDVEPESQRIGPEGRMRVLTAAPGVEQHAHGHERGLYLGRQRMQWHTAPRRIGGAGIARPRAFASLRLRRVLGEHCVCPLCLGLWDARMAHLCALGAYLRELGIAPSAVTSYVALGVTPVGIDRIGAEIAALAAVATGTAHAGHLLIVALLRDVAGDDGDAVSGHVGA